MVAVACGGSNIYGIKQLLYLAVGEGGDDFSWRLWDLDKIKGIAKYDVFCDEPGEEDSEATQVAVYGVP